MSIRSLHWGCGHLNILEETLILYLGFLSQQVMPLSISPTLELRTLHNTGGSRQNLSNQETHFLVREIRQLASHGPWSYFPSTRSSWSYRTMKRCSESRSSSTQETAPVRLGHFLVENDTWKKKKRKWHVISHSDWNAVSILPQPILDVQKPRAGVGGGRWQLSLLLWSLKIFPFHPPNHSCSVDLTVQVGEVFSPGNPVRVPPGHLGLLPPQANGRKGCSRASCALIIQGKWGCYSPIGFGRGRGGCLLAPPHPVAQINRKRSQCILTF